MKTFKTIISLSLASALTTACGRYDKQPVDDMAEMRAKGEQVRTMTDAQRKAHEADRIRQQAEREAEVKRLQNEKLSEHESNKAAWEAEKQKYKAEIEAQKQALAESRKKIDEMIKQGPLKGNDIIVEKVVEKPVEVVKEQATVDEKFIVITVEPIMQFIESQAGTYQVTARSLVKGMKIDLTASNLPEGAKIQKTSSENETVKYTLTWTPALYTVPTNSDVKVISLKLSAKVIEAPAGKNKAALQALMKEKETVLIVSRLKQSPNNIKVEGLEAEVQAGTLIPFSVTAVVPGLDDKSPLKPFLTVFYDRQDHSAGTSQIEQDGSRHVILDSGNTQAEYLGDFKWKFSMLYDTQKISVQPARGKDRNVLPNADHTLVRLSFKVTNPTSMLTSPPILKQIKIKGAATGGAL